MASTRGVKFKFSAGEKVLCYEPDPTKAKVLYESKVLDLVANRDARGRKVCEYLIHFFGWNSSWDRYVREEFILPFTTENRELQAKLAEEAALTLKGKKHKLPPLIKGTLSKKVKNESQESPKQPKSPPHSSSDTDSSEDEVEKEVIIEIPYILKKVLEEDCMCITQFDKFVRIPCENNVVSILEAYVKHYASGLLCASPPRNVNLNGQKLMPADVKNKLNLCKEVMDGLRVFFDFTLPHLLLYQQEKKQFYTIGNYATPICNYTSFKNESLIDEDMCPIKTEDAENIPKDNETVKQENDLEFQKAENETSAQNRSQKCRLNLRNKSVHTDVENAMCNDTNLKDVESKHQTSKEKRSKKSKTQSKRNSTRVLRSSDKQKPQSTNDEPTSSTSCTAENSSSPIVKADQSVLKSEQLETTSSTRITRKSMQNMCVLSTNVQQTTFSPVPSVKNVPTSPTSTILNIEHLFPVSSNYFSSSNSSTQSTMSNALLLTQRYHMRYNSNLLKDVMTWHLIPESLYEQVPASPSLLYGAHHLLRLFVKLPILISKMRIKQNKLELLLEILENFLFFLTEKRDEFFLISEYMDSSEVFPENSRLK